MNAIFLTTVVAAAALSLVHVFAGNLRFLDVIPRSRWLSFAGGVAVAYVFVHVLPELRAAQEVVARTGLPVFRFLEHHVYLMALLGLSVFYGLERAVKQARRRKPAAEGPEAATPGVFWVHMTSFAVYNALVGYLLLHREERGLANLTLYVAAMVLHFVVNDYGLRQDHQGPYHRVGRWLLAAAVWAGWLISMLTEVPEIVSSLLFSFLAGGVVLNTLKEELPEERQSRFWAFVLGVAGYAALLVAA